MLIVLDTNCLLVSISDRSKYHIVFKLIQQQQISLAYTTTMLVEYEEIISEHWHPIVASNVIKSIIELPSCFPITVYFNWHLIDSDLDDNAFVDCAIAANVDYLVTNDRHFDIVKAIDFPKLTILKLEELIELLQQ